MDNLLDTAKEKLAEMTESVTTNVTNLFKRDVLDSMKEYGIEKINDAWTEIESSTTVFKRTGYTITAISINLGIPPTIQLSLDQIDNINDEEEEKLLEENKDKTFLYPILVALFKANALQKSINSVAYKFSGLSIGLGLSPSIEMKFKQITTAS